MAIFAFSSKNVQKIIMSNSQENIEPTFKCRNCGCSCASNYCPDCGQSTAESRLENKTFFLGILSGLSRINRGFIFTAWRLLIHPWTVIRDYINCRRVRYVPPISMLIIVCFISAFISELMPAAPSGEIADNGSVPSSITIRLLFSIADFLMNSMIARNLTIYIPAMLAIPIVYRGVGARKYNIAEYFAAMIYIASSFLLFGIIVTPLSLLSETCSSAIEIIYSLLICSISMYKAFPVKSLKKRIALFILYLFVSSLIYLLILVAIATIISLNSADTINMNMASI